MYFLFFPTGSPLLFFPLSFATAQLSPLKNVGVAAVARHPATRRTAGASICPAPGVSGVPSPKPADGRLYLSAPRDIDPATVGVLLPTGCACSRLRDHERARTRVSARALPLAPAHNPRTAGVREGDPATAATLPIRSGVGVPKSVRGSRGAKSICIGPFRRLTPNGPYQLRLQAIRAVRLRV